MKQRGPAGFASPPVFPSSLRAARGRTRGRVRLPVQAARTSSREHQHDRDGKASQPAFGRHTAPSRGRRQSFRTPTPARRPCPDVATKSRAARLHAPCANSRQPARPGSPARRAPHGACQECRSAHPTSAYSGWREVSGPETRPRGSPASERRTRGAYESTDRGVTGSRDRPLSHGSRSATAAATRPSALGDPPSRSTRGSISDGPPA